MAKKGTVVVKFLGDSSNLDSTMGKVEGRFGSFGSSIGKLGAVIGGAFAVDKIKDFGLASIDAFGESEKVAAQTEARLRSTGGAAGVTADHISNLSNKLMYLSGVEDESIQSGANMLLTFTNIKNGVGEGNDIFDQATKTMLNMSIALGTDTPNAARLLGKALNDPVKGLQALQRVGIRFTDDQKAQIKALVESGRTMDAQKIILAELERRFGGAAKAAGDAQTPIERFRLRMGELEETVGGKLVGAFDRVSRSVGELFKGDFTSSLAGEIGKLFGWAEDDERVAKISGVFDTIADSIGRFRDFVVAAAPQVVETVRSILEQFGPSFERVGTLIAPLGEMFRSAFDAIAAIVQRVVEVVSDLWARFGDDLVGHMRVALDAIVQILQGAIQVLTGIFDMIKAVLTGKWGEAWHAVLEIFGGLWNVIVGVIRAAVNSLSTIIDAAKALISAAWSALWNGLATLFSDLWAGVTNVVSGALSGLVSLISGMPARIRTAAAGMWDGITAAFKAAINTIIRGWNSLSFKIPEFSLGPIKFGGFTLSVPKIPLLAQGGTATSSGLAVVGENGPELLNLPRGASVVPLNRGAAVGQSFVWNGDVIVQGHVLTEADLVEAVGDGIVRRLRLEGIHV